MTQSERAQALADVAEDALDAIKAIRLAANVAIGRLEVLVGELEMIARPDQEQLDRAAEAAARELLAYLAALDASGEDVAGQKLMRTMTALLDFAQR